MYKVLFYQQKDGKKPIKKFMDSTQNSLRAKINKQILSLQKYGLTIDNPYLRKLTGTQLWESRILGRENTRIICMTYIDKKIVILNIFKKKSQKTPIREIEISLRRYKDLTNDI